MPVYSAFAPSTLGMKSQAQSLGTISMNIANATTGGYKRTETRFQTVLSEALQQQSDLGGVRPIDVQMIDRQGIVLTTSRDLDLAIVGDGFFVVSTALTGGETFYTRDGSFEMKLETPGTGTGAATTAPGYLVDRNGYYLKGWAPDPTTGVFPTTGTPQAMRVDSDFFANTFEATTKVDLGLNLPADAALIANHATAVANADSGTPPAGFQTYSISVIDSAGKRQPVRLNFTRSALNTWQVSATHSRTPTAQVNTVTLAGTIEASDVYTVTVAGSSFTYTTTGAEANISAVRDNLITQINAAPSLPITAAAGGAGGITLTADTAGNAFTSSASATNGGATADNTAVSAITTPNVTNTTTTAATTVPFTNTGASGTKTGTTVTPPAAIAYALTFNGGTTVSFNLDLATTTQFDTGFVALNQSVNGFEKSQLRSLSWDQDGFLVGNFNNDNSRRLYKVPLANFTSPNNLTMRNGMVFEENEASGAPRIEDPRTTGRASFAAGAIESSNVDIAQEFTRMIQTQAVYNANALAFRTNDELTMTARDLTRA